MSDSWNSFDDYAAWVRTKQTSWTKEKKSDRFWIGDLIDSNLKASKTVISSAERVNWGRFAHAGYQSLIRLKKAFHEVESKRHEVDYSVFKDMCKWTKEVCALLWQAENL